MDRRTRLLRALTRQEVDRVPVICTGGNMGATPEQVVAASGFSLREAHCNPEAMAGLALAAARITGFECAGVPLCTTVEAEAFGALIELGDDRTEARIVHEPFASAADVELQPVDVLLRRGRVGVAVEAVRQLAATAGDLPIIANLIGPLSIAASVVEPLTFLRELRTRPADARALASRVTDFLVAWSQQLVAAGADAVTIHEDTVTPALVGPRTFEQEVFPHLERLVAAIHSSGARVLLHMCGALGKAAEAVSRLACDGFIADAALSPAELRQSLPNAVIVGNVSTFLLHQGEPAGIGKLARRLVGDGGVDVLSPTCGMSSITPLDNILAMTGAARCPAAPLRERSENV